VTQKIRVTVKFFGYLKEGGGELIEEIEVSPQTTVKEVVDLFRSTHQASLAAISKKSSPSQNFEETYGIMLNGMSLEKNKQLTATVREGDKITIFSPICGG
jgi:molybdopterin converting factor small subunit